MKIIYSTRTILMFLLLSVYCDNVIAMNQFESQVLLLLEKWRMGQYNSALILLPSLKSVYMPHIEYNFDRKGIKMTYEINKIELTGLDNFTIEELIASESKRNLKISISVNVPKLILFAEKYELKGRAYMLYPLKGSGNMTVIFRDIDLTFKTHFGTTEDNIGSRLRHFLLDFNVGNIEASLANSSWPINKVLNSDGAEILASYHDDIVQAMWDYLVPYVNQHLVNVTTAQIVNAILKTSLNV